MIVAAMQWFALVLTGAALAAAVSALLARSLFAMCIYLSATGALGAAAALALGAGDAGLAIALFAAVWTPLLLLAAMLLSARATKTVRRGVPWLSLLAAFAAVAAIFAVAPDLGAPVVDRSDATLAVSAWLAPLLLVAAAACVGVLGYGERGALQRSAERDL